MTEGAGPQNLLINLLGVALFGGLFTLDSRGAEQRVQQRKAIREAQIRAGDREVFVNDQGETMSRLKEVGAWSAWSALVEVADWFVDWEVSVNDQGENSSPEGAGAVLCC